MAGTWDEDGVDDLGNRMVDRVALQIEAEEALAAAGRDKTAAAAASGSGGSPSSSVIAAAGGQLFGRQRQVQHLREVHRQKLEQLRKERADDDDQVSSDDEHMRIEKRKREQQQQQQQESQRSAGVPRYSLLTGAEASQEGSGVVISPSGRMERSVSFSPVLLSPIPKGDGFRSHGGSKANRSRPQKQAQHSAFTNNGRSNADSTQRHARPVSPSAEHSQQQRNVTGGVSTPSSATSGDDGALTILDIGSDKLPLRFFPDQRTISGWRGVVQPKARPLKYGSGGGSRSTSRPITPPASKVQDQRSIGRSGVASTPAVGSPAQALRRQQQPQQQQQQQVSVLTHHYELPIHRLTSPPPGSHRGGIAGFEKRVSLRRSHVTVFDTFRAPDPVPAFHRQHHHNAAQEHIMRALPAPKSDVDVAFLRPAAASAVGSGSQSPSRRGGGGAASASPFQPNSSNNNSSVQVLSAFGTTRSRKDILGAGTNRSNARVAAFLVDGKPAELLSDVRLIVLDDVHGNAHRRVERQLEVSPERLPKRRVVPLSKEQRRAERMWVKEELQNRQRTAAGGMLLQEEEARAEQHAEERAAADAVQRRREEERAAAVAARRKTRMLLRQDAHLHAMQSEQQQLQQRDSVNNINNSGGAGLASCALDDLSSDDDPDADADAFVSVADEKVVVGGDVVGGKPLLLPKVRGRWDAMRDALKERYFSKPPPAVEPIAHALRVIPLAEICSMYRQCIKECKGALEMDRRLFAVFVKMMLAALPGNPKATEAEIDKYWGIADLNGGGSVSFIETLTTVVDFQTDKRETLFLRSLFNNLLTESGQAAAVESGDLAARVPWALLESSEKVFEQVLRALNRSSRFPRVVEKTFADCLAVSMRAAHTEAESAMCQETLEGLFWEQFRLLVCLDAELIIPLRTLRLAA